MTKVSFNGRNFLISVQPLIMLPDGSMVGKGGEDVNWIPEAIAFNTFLAWHTTSAN